jgi:dynein heavy chain
MLLYAVRHPMQGLEEQLLAELVRAERPELEESHDSLTTSISADKRQLGDLESKILRLLQEASGNLLDDETLISTLNTAKQTSGGFACEADGL